MKRALFLSTAPWALIVGFAGTASAQESSTPAPATASQAGDQVKAGDNFGEIVVTARRRGEALQSVPLAITAINSAKLETRTVRSVTDLNSLAPSIIIAGATGRRDTPSIGIRGQKVSDSLISTDPAVALYLNEVILTPTMGGNLALFDLANIQVLKGPQGTLFGRNTTGGALLFTTNQPTDKLGGSITAHVGNYNEKGVTGYVNVPITSTLSLRLSGNYLQHDGYSRIVAGPQAGHKLSGDDNKSGRAILSWKPSSSFSNSMLFAYDHGASNGTPFVLTALDPATSIRFFNGTGGKGDIFAALARQQARSPRKLEANQAQFETIHSKMFIDTATVDLGGVQLKNIFGYRKMHYTLSYDGDDSPFNIFSVNNPSHESQYSDEVQLSGKAFDGKMQWIAGVYYFLQKGDDISRSISLQGLNPNTPGRAGGYVNNMSLSGYIQQSTEILPRLSLTTGLRYTVDRRRVTIINHTEPDSGNPNVCNLTDAGGNRLPFNACFVNLEKTFSKPTWIASLDYKLGRNKLIYIKTSRGYRSGGFNLRATTPVQERPFRPETVTDGEIGAKIDSHPFGWSVRTNGAFYLQKYKDIQRTVTFVNPANGQVTSSIINAASATIWGAEFEATIVPNRRLSIDFSYSYTHPKYDSFPTASGDFSDRRFAMIPRHQFNIDLDYKLVDREDVGVVTLHGNYNYRSGFYISETYQTGQQVRTQAGLNPALTGSIPDVIPGSWIPKVGLFNARLSWDHIMGSRFSAAAYVKNLTNKLYTNGGLGLYESLGLDLNTYGDPRTFGLEVKVDF